MEGEADGDILSLLTLIFLLSCRSSISVLLRLEEGEEERCLLYGDVALRATCWAASDAGVCSFFIDFVSDVALSFSCASS